MNPVLLRQMKALAEAAPTLPTDRKARTRQGVQGAYDGLVQLMPQIQADVSQLAPELMGELSSAHVKRADQVCQRLADHARKLLTQVDRLRNSIAKHGDCLED